MPVLSAEGSNSLRLAWAIYPDSEGKGRREKGMRNVEITVNFAAQE